MNLKYGIVSEFKKGYAKVYFEENDFVSDFLPVLVRKSKTDKESWQLEINEHVVCIMDENCNEGVIIGAIPNENDLPDTGEGAGKFRKLFSDGTLIEYDKNAHKLLVDVKGSAEVKTTTSAKIDAGTTLEAKAGVKATIEAVAIELKGVVTITGACTITGALAAAGIASTGGLPISATGDISTTGDIKAGAGTAAISLKNHKHGGVQTGGGLSGLPLP